MTTRRPFLLALVAGATAILACTTPSSVPATSSPGQEPASAEPQPLRTLSAAIRVEPASIAGNGLQQSSLTLGATERTFNAGLTLIDDRDQPRPYLAETLPRLNSDTWGGERGWDDGDDPQAPSEPHPARRRPTHR